ncbi:MAG: helix-turn-helix domain-containing protein [Polyangiaceae bacterium]
MGGSQSRLASSQLEARRSRAIGLVSEGATQAEVARRLGVTREAVRQWMHAYRTGGPAALAPRPRRERGRVPLADLAQTIERASRAGEPLTTSGVRGALERSHGILYSASSVRAILRRLGYVHTRERSWLRAELDSLPEDSKRIAG